MKLLSLVKKTVLALSVIASSSFVGGDAMADGPVIGPIGPIGGGDGPIIAHLATVVQHCSSSRYRYAECAFPGEIALATVQRKHSQAACVFNRSYGFHGNILWVKAGCRADFEVSYVDTRELPDLFP